MEFDSMTPLDYSSLRKALDGVLAEKKELDDQIYVESNRLAFTKKRLKETIAAKNKAILDRSDVVQSVDRLSGIYAVQSRHEADALSASFDKTVVEMADLRSTIRKQDILLEGIKKQQMKLTEEKAEYEERTLLAVQKGMQKTDRTVS